jgi:hypothetical protein
MMNDSTPTEALRPLNGEQAIDEAISPYSADAYQFDTTQLPLYKLTRHALAASAPRYPELTTFS